MHKERKELEVTNSNLLEQVLNLKKEKKQQGIVFTVSAAAIICFFILLGVMQSLDTTQGNLALSQEILRNTQKELEQTSNNFEKIKKQNGEMQSSFLSQMSEKDRQIISLQQQNEQLTTDMEILKTELRQSEMDNYNTKRDLSRYKNELKQAETENYNLRRDLNHYKNELKRAETDIKNSRDKISQDTWRQSQSTTYTSSNISKAIVIINTPMRTEPRHTASIKANIPKEASIEVFNNEYKNGYYKVKYRRIIGYVAKVFINFK